MKDNLYNKIKIEKDQNFSYGTILVRATVTFGAIEEVPEELFRDHPEIMEGVEDNLKEKLIDHIRQETLKVGLF